MYPSPQFRRLLILAFLPIFLIGCFEIKEEVYIKKDGSGQFRLLLDFSKHQQLLGALSQEASTQAYPTFGEGSPFQELIDTWTAGADDLNHINGIRNAIAITNKDAFIYGWQFDFDDIDVLNLVLAIKDGGEFNTNYLPAYSFSKKQVNRHSNFIFHRLIRHFSENVDEGLSLHLKKQKNAIFAGIQYRCTISVSGKVRRYSNKSYQMTADKKQLSLLAPLEEVLAGKAYIGNQVKFK